jgi:hypothetical protein
MPIPREHILADPWPEEITPEDRLYMMAVEEVNKQDISMTQPLWIRHLSLILSIPKWQSAILWKRLEKEKKIKFLRKFSYKNLYLAVHNSFTGIQITTDEEYNYKFRGGKE